MSDEPFVSYSQNFEDVVLARALQPDVHKGFWVDVGAGDPTVDSVTAAFSERGWTGVNIEPVPTVFDALRKARPFDTNLCIALGAEPGTGILYTAPDERRGTSTLVPELAQHYRDEGWDFEPIEVSISTLAAVTAEYTHGTVDFLKIDVEGAEFGVLAGGDWSTCRPRIIVVEATAPNSTTMTHEAWEPILLDAGYEFVLFDGLNRYYVEATEDRTVRDALRVPANVLDGFVPHATKERERFLIDLDARLFDALTSLEEANSTTEELRSELAAIRATRTFRLANKLGRLCERLHRHRQTRHRRDDSRGSASS